MDNHAAADAIRAAACTMRDDEDAEAAIRLIGEKGFDALAVEADWPDALRVSRFIRGGRQPGDGDARAASDVDGALAGFRRFPRWMWRN